MFANSNFHPVFCFFFRALPFTVALDVVQHVPAGPQMSPDLTLLMHFSTFLEPSTRCARHS